MSDNFLSNSLQMLGRLDKRDHLWDVIFAHDKALVALPVQAAVV